jgi:cell division protein FtsI/penicillin-binding protein 2
MKKVVTGTASVSRWMVNNKKIPVTVGGKTGTAQTGKDCDNALFVAAAPYNDPDIVISVVLEKGYSGGLASLTTARILEAYYSEQ